MISNCNRITILNWVKLKIMRMLMLPILGTINFMLPIFTTFKSGEVNEVALLDCALSLGMALIAIILSKFLSHNWLHIFFIVGISITALWYLAENALVIKLLLMLLFGFTFGGARIIFRKSLLQHTRVIL